MLGGNGRHSAAKVKNKIMKRLLILTIALILTVNISNVFGQTDSSKAEYMTAFGLKLGEPFNVPECPIIEKKYLGGKKYDEYATDTEVQSMCFQRKLSPYKIKERVQLPLPPLYPTGYVGLVIPYSKRPDYIYDSYDINTTIMAYLIDGNFVGADFDIVGFDSPMAGSIKSLVSDLTAKYGKPAKVSAQELQNNYGARFTTYIYEWQLPGLAVVYNEHIGNFTGIPRGRVSVVTPILAERRRQDEKKADENKKKDTIPF